MNGNRLALGCLAALALLVGGLTTMANEPGETYTIIVKSAKVMETTDKGEAWDVNNGKPDLAVIIRNLSDKGSSTFETKEKSDTFSADFNEPTTIKFQAGQVLEFEVVDKDVAVHDTIGKITKEHKDGVIKEGVLKMENFGRVIHLEVEIKRL